MDKQSIIEYVEETPHNTNRVILNQMLDEFAESSGTGGVQANWEQNDPTAIDYVQNRTHYIDNRYPTLIYNSETGEGLGWNNSISFEPINKQTEPSYGWWLGNRVFSIEYESQYDREKYTTFLDKDSLWRLQETLEDGTMRYYCYISSYPMPKGGGEEEEFGIWVDVKSKYYTYITVTKFRLQGDVPFILTLNERTVKTLAEEFVPAIANWGENDTDSNGYISNRTHYIEIKKKEIWHWVGEWIDETPPHAVGTMPYTEVLTSEENDGNSGLLGDSVFL